MWTEACSQRNVEALFYVIYNPCLTTLDISAEVLGSKFHLHSNDDQRVQYKRMMKMIKVCFVCCTGCLLISVACLGINNLVIFWSLRAEILKT